MPDRPLTLCTAPGCSNRVRSGRCPAHAKAKYKAQDELRGSAASRGYDSTWRITRAAKLESTQYLCEQCKTEGFDTLATEVHHKVTIRQDPTKRLDFDNLMSLC